MNTGHQQSFLQNLRVPYAQFQPQLAESFDIPVNDIPLMMGVVQRLQKTAVRSLENQPGDMFQIFTDIAVRQNEHRIQIGRHMVVVCVVIIVFGRV